MPTRDQEPKHQAALSQRTPTPARPPAAETGDDALRVLAAALMPHLRETFAYEAGEAQLVDVAKFLPLPRRTVHNACRRGDLVAVKVGRRWIATRAAIDAWLRVLALHPIPPLSDDDDLEELRRSLLRPSSRRRTRNRVS